MELYEKPEVDVIEYSTVSDIVTASGNTNNNSLENGDDYNIIP